MSIGMNISITNKMINFICILTKVRNINISNIHFIQSIKISYVIFRIILDLLDQQNSQLLISLQVLRCGITFGEYFQYISIDIIYPHHFYAHDHYFFNNYQKMFHSLQEMVYNWPDKTCGFLAKSYYFIQTLEDNILDQNTN